MIALYFACMFIGGSIMTLRGPLHEIVRALVQIRDELHVRNGRDA